MSTCNIKFEGEDCEVDYHFDCEDLVIDEMIGEDGYVFDYGSLHKDDKEEIEAKVLKYLEEKEDWVESEASEECTRRMEARMEANWSK